MGIEMRSGDGTTDGAISWQRFSVPYEYPVAFTRDALAPGNTLLAGLMARREPGRRHRCLVFVDDGLVAARPDLPARIEAYADAHAARVELVDAPLQVAGGERSKLEPRHLVAMQDAIHRHRIDRHSYVVAIGGGAVLDAVGYAAATAHRGVRHIRMPSTTLSQNDSGVGVKNAVNLHGLKNYSGTFAPPWAVLNDFDLLAALPERERRAGLAEAVKVALIRDRVFYEWLEGSAARLAAFEPLAEEYMIRRCAELHMRQIAHGGDPFEMGSARPLDFGHWAAHKLEALTAHAVSHGEAVAIGVALDTRYSVLAGLLPQGSDERVARLLERMGFALHHPALSAPGAGGGLALIDGLAEFREHLGGELTITLLRDLGVGHEVHDIDPGLVARSLSWLAARADMGEAA
jgi:3-dehydroquinate synthase